jgi:hypothetical protein
MPASAPPQAFGLDENRVRGGGNARFADHRHTEAIPELRDGLKSVATEHFSQGHDDVRQVRVRDVRVGPQRVDQLVTVHQAFGVAHEEQQRVERFRLERQPLSRLPELSLGGYQLEDAEAVRTFVSAVIFL